MPQLTRSQAASQTKYGIQTKSQGRKKTPEPDPDLSTLEAKHQQGLLTRSGRTKKITEIFPPKKGPAAKMPVVHQAEHRGLPMPLAKTTATTHLYMHKNGYQSGIETVTSMQNLNTKKRKRSEFEPEVVVA